MRTINYIFFWVLWTIGVLGNITIVYGYMNGSLTQTSPILIALCVFFFTITPILILWSEERQGV